MIIEDIKIDNYTIKCVRDDYFPFVLGGNKARKAVYYEKEIQNRGCNAVVTTGGIQSNHCRAIALLCAKNQWKCHIVYHGTKERFFNEKGNAEIVRLSGSSYEFVASDEISDAMNDSMQRFKAYGFKPYYCTGGGHDICGAMAFIDAVSELKTELQKISWKPDVIYHASGTGSTQIGLLLGLNNVGWDDVKLIGISVARNKNRGIQVLTEFAKEVSTFANIYYQDSQIILKDEYLLGGYESSSFECNSYLNDLSKSTGLILDPTYSGKAFWGMKEDLKSFEDDILKVLFWNTGGIFNIMK